MTATDHNNHNMSSSYWTGAPYDSSSDEDLIHLPILPKLPTIPRPYQATVEDCPEDDDSDLFVESDSTASASGSPPPLNRRRSSPNPHQSSSPTPRSSRAGRDHRDGFYAYTESEDERERGRRQQQQPKPRVHFWDRGPDAPVPSDASNNSSSTQNSSRKRTVNPVEFQWGALFDARYNPTSRVRQVYRAVAKHMVSPRVPLILCQV